MKIQAHTRMPAMLEETWEFEVDDNIAMLLRDYPKMALEIIAGGPIDLTFISERLVDNNETGKRTLVGVEEV